MTIPHAPRDSGFSLAELLVAMAVMLLISGAAISALLKMTSTQATIWNRTQMHSGIRGATEVLQQEVGQAGRIAVTPAVQTTGTNAACTTAGCTTTLQVGAVGGGSFDANNTLFVGERLVVDIGTIQETVRIVTIDSATQLTVAAVAASGKVGSHQNNVPIQVFGAFSAGVIPPLTSPSAYAPGGPTASFANGSTGDTLKLFGDINADNNMVYVEYKCDLSAGNLTRNVMPWNQTTASAAATPSQILLSNIQSNPDGSPCFTYQLSRVDTTYFVTDVAITLTVRTQLIDQITKQYQTETKALLNVSPRNVFSAWQLASLGVMERVQPTPQRILNLLP